MWFAIEALLPARAGVHVRLVQRGDRQPDVSSAHHDDDVSAADLVDGQRPYTPLTRLLPRKDERKQKRA